MSQTVWKSALLVRDEPDEFTTFRSWRVVRVEHAPGGRGDEVLIWFVGDPDGPRIERWLAVSGTGHPVPDHWVYLGGTDPHPRHGAVWHVWEVPARG